MIRQQVIGCGLFVVLFFVFNLTVADMTWGAALLTAIPAFGGAVGIIGWTYAGAIHSEAKVRDGVLLLRSWPGRMRELPLTDVAGVTTDSYLGLDVALIRLRGRRGPLIVERGSVSLDAYL